MGARAHRLGRFRRLSSRRHSVANTAKRAIIIVGCAIAFGESMAPLKMIGCSVAIGGTAAGFEVALSFARPAFCLRGRGTLLLTLESTA